MAKKDRAKAEQRRTAREQRRAAQQRAAAQRRRQRTLIWSGVGALVVVGVFALLAWSGALGQQAAAVLGRKIEAPPGERVPEAAPIHIQQGARGSGYTTNPPTSGEHYGTSEAPWGVHTQPLPDELIIHNLEHAGIWISYKDPTDTALAAKLAQVARRYATKVIVTPRPQNDAPIAVAAWGHLLKLQEFDEAKIVAFITAYRGKVGPEPQGP